MYPFRYENGCMRWWEAEGVCKNTHGHNLVFKIKQRELTLKKYALQETK